LPEQIFESHCSFVQFPLFEEIKKTEDKATALSSVFNPLQDSELYKIAT